jgi:PAS domain S-box-containing protein
MRGEPVLSSKVQHAIAPSGVARRVAVGFALYALTVGALALLGWYIREPRLTDWIGRDIAMFANTALAAILAGTAVILLVAGRRGTATALGAVCGALGLATLIEHLSGVSLGIDTLLAVPRWGLTASAAPGRMGPPGATSFTLLGAAIIFAARGGRLRALAPAPAGIVTAIASLSFLGFLMGANPLYSLPRLTGIAFQTTTSLMALSVAVMAAVPEHQPARMLCENSAAGMLARRALPFVIVLPVLLGFLTDRAEEARYLDTSLGVAVLVMALILMLGGLLWWTAAAVRARENDLREREEIFRTMFEITSVGMAKTDAEGRLVRVNQTFADLLGEEPRALLGRPLLDFTHPEDRERDEDLTRALLAGDLAPCHAEKRFVRSDRSVVWAQVTADLVRDRSGSPFRTVMVVQDITNRKHTEQALARRAREQSVLYAFTDRLQRADSLPDVHDAALSAIISALACHRASILLFDDSGQMRFVAWHGLSDGYRAAVEGHSPWTADTVDPQPITIQDIQTSDAPSDLKRVVSAEGIAALAFIPLVAGGRLIGKFMAYHDRPHAFTPDELGLALAIARQLSFAVERRRAELALRESEQRLRLATQTGKVGIWEWDIAADRVVWTESLYAIHGVDKEQFGGTIEAFTALVHPDDRVAVSDAIERSLTGGAPYELELRVRRPSDRTIAWVFTSAVVHRENGKPVRMIGATLDITERKSAQEVLAESERLFRTLGEAVPDFLLMTDAQGTPLYQNPAWRHYTGIGAEEMSRDGWHEVIHPDELPMIRRLWEQSLASGSPFDFEARIRRYDGRHRWFTGRTVPVCNEAGKIMRWVGTLTDIHDRKQLERERDDHAADLALALAQRTEQITRAQQRLAANDRLAAVGTLAAGLGHDLSNLLLPLTARLEGLKLRNDLPEDVHADIDAADGLISHLRALARNLRLFVRDPSQIGGEAATDLSDWVARTSRFLAVLAGGADGSDARLEYDIPQGLPAVAVAPHQLTQAVTNLIHNAREAIIARAATFAPDSRHDQSETHSGREGDAATRGLIRISARAQDGEVRLRVSDNGSGMNEEVRRRCMEPFFTTRDRPADPSRVGTGIGLSTVHAAVTQAGGRIEIESRLGVGTTFTLHLPLAMPKRPSAPVRPVRSAGRPERPHTELQSLPGLSSRPRAP